MIISIKLLLLNLLITVESRTFSMIKEIKENIYIGGENYLSRHKFNGNRIDKVIERYYIWPELLMNGSDIGFDFNVLDKRNISMTPQRMAFDTCLNWQQEHLNKTKRETSFDYQHWKYHTPSGDWLTMNFTCMNSFIRSVELMDNNRLWVCGTFGGFPRAFSVNETTLEFIQFVDVNVMSCARYVDEPMATFRDKSTNDLYIASGWGLYRPDKRNPDVPDNNSTMLYADWRLYRNLFTLPSAMAWVLSSDVNFINVVKETNDHLYFFGHEINNQYGLNNQEDRNAWQSFLLRICKHDLGFKYVPAEMATLFKYMTNEKYYLAAAGSDYYVLSPIHEEMDRNLLWYQNTIHLPTTHFVTPLKINFGCYLGKRPRAISDNHFWGQTNVIYFNQLVDVIFDPTRKVKFQTKSNNEYFGCQNEPHSQIPLIGLFNSPGIQGTPMPPSGALCQLQINENIFNDVGSSRKPYHNFNLLNVKHAHEEIMALSSMSYSNFYSRSLHRTNGFTLYPYWNQGVLIGDHKNRPYYHNAFDDIGACKEESFYKTLTKDKFLKIQNFTNTAWPNELPNRLSSIPSAICQYSAAELYSFNATFILKDVEFKKIFLLRDNITNYQINPVKNGSEISKERNYFPIMIVIILSTTGRLYRVVLCDFDNGMINHAENKTSNEWYNWCIFRHTDQPYLYRQYAPMERREWGESYQYRASSLLLDKKIVNKSDETSFPINRDPQFHIVKDVLRKGDYLHVLTAINIHKVNIGINCSRDYNTCVDCASDPDCMWNIIENKCELYNDSKYNDSLFVQDVFDRGFKCATLIKTKNTTINFEKNVSETNSISFRCVNAGLWRDKIEWRINNDKVVGESEDYILKTNKSHLILMKNDIINISCYGIRTDYDKLYKGAEYEWINDSYSRQLLHIFVMIKSPSVNPQYMNAWIVFLVMSIFLNIILISCLIRKCIHCPRQINDKKIEETRRAFLQESTKNI